MSKKFRTINHLLAFFVPAITVLIGFILSGFAPFGNMNVLSFDGLYEYIPYFNELYDRVHSGESLIYSLREGMGYNYTSVYSFYLSDPTNLLVLLFPKAYMSTIFNLLYMLKIGLAGLSFSILLTNIEKSKTNTIINLKPAMFGICYALSGYMLGQGLNITWLTSVAIFPLLILGLKNIIDKNNIRLFVIFYALTFVANIYIGILISVFMVFFFVTRDFTDVRHFIKSLLLFIAGSLLGAGCAMVVILPSVKSTFFSDLINISFPYRGFATIPADTFKMMLPGSLPSVVSQNAFGINIFSGTLILLLIVCYMFNKGIKFSTKMKNLGLTALLFISTVFVTTNYLFNGFYEYDNNTVNFGFILVFMLLIISYDSFGSINKLSSIKLAISCFLVLFTIVATMLFASDYESVSPFITGMELVLLYFVIILLYKKENVSRFAFRIAIMVILTAEISTVYIKTLQASADETQLYKYTDTYALEEATDFIKNLEPGARIMKYYGAESNSTPLTNMLEGYDYVITTNSEQVVDTMLEYIGSYEGVDIYKNNYKVPMGFLANTYVKSWHYDTGYPYKSLNTLTSNGIKGVEGTELFVPVEGELGFNITERKDLDANGRAYDFSVIAPVNCDLYMNFYDVVHIGQVAAGEVVTYTYKLSAEQMRNFRLTLTYTDFDKEAYENLYNNIISADITSLTENEKSGFIEAISDGVFVSNIPYEKGWTVTVDGKEVQTYSVSDKYLAFDLTKGTHELKLSYSPIHLKTGALLSILFILLSVIVLSKSVSGKIAGYASKLAKSKPYGVFTDFLSNNRVYVYYTIITTAITLLILMIKSCLPFGEYIPMGNDAYAQSLPYITNIIDQFRNLEFGTVNWHMGFGVDNIIILLSGGAFPINFLMLLFPKSMEVFAFTFIFYVKLIIIGIVFIYYLTHRTSGKIIDKKSNALIALALAYTFNSFVISYFNNITFLDMAIMLPIVILGLEYLFTKKDIRLYTISLAVSMFFNVYYSFLLCMFLVLYFITLHFDNFKDFIKKGLRFAYASIIAAGMALASLLPFYISTTLSPYQSSDALPSFDLSFNFMYELQRLMPAGEPVIVDFDFTHSNIYCGLLTVIFIGLFALNKQINKTDRIKRIAVLVILFMAFGNEFLNFVFHGFHKQTGVPNRFAIFWIFLMLICLYDVFVDIKSYSSKKLFVVPAVTSVIFIILNGIQADTILLKLQLTFSTIVILIYIITLLLNLLKKLDTSKVASILSAVLATELILAGGFNFFYIGQQHIAYDIKDINSLNQISNELDLDKDLYYSEYIDSPIPDIGLMVDMNHVTIFSSGMTRYTVNLFTNLGGRATANSCLYKVGNPLFNTLMSVKYAVVNAYYDASVTTFDTIYEYDNLTVAENKYALPHGVFMTAEPEAFDNLEYLETRFNYHNYIATYLSGCDDIYEIYELDYADSQDSVNESTNFYAISDSSKAIVENDSYSNTTNVELILNVTPDTSGPLYMSSNGIFLYLGDVKAGETSDFSIVYTKDDILKMDKDEAMYVAISNDLAIEQLYNALVQHTAYDFNYDNNGITCKIDAPSDGYTFMNLPYSPGWTAYVDGIETDIDIILDGAIYIPVTKGSHTIELKYNCPGFVPGLIGSLISIILLVVVIKIKKKKDIKEPNS